MKIYSPINQMRLLDIRVFDMEIIVPEGEDNKRQIVYEGPVENVPEEIGKWRYSEAKKMNPIELYVYAEGKE